MLYLPCLRTVSKSSMIINKYLLKNRTVFFTLPTYYFSKSIFKTAAYNQVRLILQKSIILDSETQIKNAKHFTTSAAAWS